MRRRRRGERAACVMAKGTSAVGAALTDADWYRSSRGCRPGRGGGAAARAGLEKVTGGPGLCGLPPVVLRITLRKKRSASVVSVPIDVARVGPSAPPLWRCPRPGCCPRCSAAGHPAGQLVGLVGHGLRMRQVRGAMSPCEGRLSCIRSGCVDIGAVMPAAVTVVPRGCVPARHYGAGAIAMACVLYGLSDEKPELDTGAGVALEVGGARMAFDDPVAARHRGRRRLRSRPPVSWPLTCPPSGGGGWRRASWPSRRPRGPSSSASLTAPRVLPAVDAPPPGARQRPHLVRSSRTEAWLGSDPPARQTPRRKVDRCKRSLPRTRPKPVGVALYRAQIIGALTVRQLDRGELRAALGALAERSVSDLRARTHRKPTRSRRSSAGTTPTRRGGLEALRPQPRTDKGRGRELTDAQRQLLLDIRARAPVRVGAAHPAHARGRRAARTPARSRASTVRRLYQEHGLDRAAPDGAGGGKHAPALAGRAAGRALARRRLPRRALLIGGNSPPAAHPRPARRRLALRRRARGAPRRARGRHARPPGARRCAATARPTRLYLDNGATYRGETLAPRVRAPRHRRSSTPGPTTRRPAARWSASGAPCARAASIHLGWPRSLHDVNVRLWAFLDDALPQARRTPASWARRPRASSRADAHRRRLRRGTSSARRSPCTTAVASAATRRLDGRRRLGDSTWASSPAASSPSPLPRRARASRPRVEHEGQRLPPRTASTPSPMPAARARRLPSTPHTESRVSFDPPGALLDADARPRSAPTGGRPMTPELLSLFGLSAEPFSKEIDDADLWLPPTKQATARRVASTPREARQSVFLVGEPGVGKTCVLRALRTRAAQAALPADLLPQRHARPPRLLSAALPRPGPATGGHRRRRLLGRQHPRRRAAAGRTSRDRRSAASPTRSRR